MFDKQDLFNKYYDNYMCKVAYSANMDTYNRRYMNIANPSQVQRWRSRGFSDAQIRAYTDSQVRKSMGGYTPTSAGRYNNNMLPGQPTQQYNNTYRQNNQYQFRSRQPVRNQYNSSVATAGGYTTPNTSMSPQMDTYNRRYANIANPSQINRWKANGFSDSQIRQYTDNKVRNSMGGFSPYGSAPNPYNSTYTKRYNNIANPAQIARWRAKGFSDAQIRQYTDSQVRKSMAGRGY